MTLREWREHKLEMEEVGVCATCPLKGRCDALRTDEDAQAFVTGALRSFVIALALALGEVEVASREAVQA